MAPKVPADDDETAPKKDEDDVDRPESSVTSDDITASSKPDPIAKPAPIAPPRSRTRSDGKDTTTAQADKVARYLKSAMKNAEDSDNMKLVQDDKPERPVRNKAPSGDENCNAVKKSTCIFDNLEYLLTSDINMDAKASMDSFYGDDDTAKVDRTSTDATVQCSFPIAGGNHTKNGMNAVFDTMLQMNSRTLSAVGSAWLAPSRVPWWTAETDWLACIDEGAKLCCRSGDAVFYDVTRRDQKDNPVAVMVSECLML